MIETKTTNTNLTIIDFNGQGPGLYKIIRGFDESIIQKVLIMSVITNTLNSLNKVLDEISEELKNDGIAEAKSTKWTSILGGIMTAVLLAGTIAGATSFLSYSEVAEGEQATKLQQFHNFLISYGTKAQMTASISLGMIKAYFVLKQGQYSSASMKIQGVNAQLSPIVDSYQDTMEGSSQTINSEMKAIKEMLQNDYSSKTKGLYFYNLK